MLCLCIHAVRVSVMYACVCVCVCCAVVCAPVCTCGWFFALQMLCVVCDFSDLR